MKNKKLSETPLSEEFERFKDMAKKLLAVPKKEVDRRVAKANTQKLDKKKTAA